MTHIPLANVGHSLNPPALITSFFTLGLVGHLMSWVLLGLAGDDALYAVVGPGPALAALHAMTGGTLLPVAIGACFQMLPVLCQRPPPPRSGAWCVFVLVSLGQFLQIFGLYDGVTLLIGAGAALTAAGLLVFILTMIPILHRGDFRFYPETRLGTSLSLFCLLAAMSIGVALGLNYTMPFLDRPDLMGTAHGLIATFGVMGLLVLGFSPFVIPMVFLSKPEQTGLAQPVIFLAGFALIVVLCGVLLGNLTLKIGGLLLALVVVGLHIYHMERLLRNRLRRKGRETAILCRVSWGCLVVSLMIACLAVVGRMGDDWMMPFALATFYGWLLSLVIAVIGRILPFLTAMYTVRYCRQPVLVTALAPARLLWWQLGFHLIAVALALLAWILDQVWVLQMAAVAGILSSLALLVFAGIILWRALCHRRAVGPKAAPVYSSD